jgi:hypothetical protein
MKMKAIFSSKESDSTLQLSFIYPEDFHSPAPRCGIIASVAFIPWRVKQAANKLCWLASMCKYNTQGSYSYIIIAEAKREAQ